MTTATTPPADRNAADRLARTVAREERADRARRGDDTPLPPAHSWLALAWHELEAADQRLTEVFTLVDRAQRALDAGSWDGDSVAGIEYQLRGVRALLVTLQTEVGHERTRRLTP